MMPSPSEKLKFRRQVNPWKIKTMATKKTKKPAAKKPVAKKKKK